MNHFLVSQQGTVTEFGGRGRTYFLIDQTGFLPASRNNGAFVFVLKAKVKTHLPLGRETSEGVKTLMPNHPLYSHNLSFQIIEAVFISQELVVSG